jgi:formylglycine-generating enzyme required for sulfatase activity
MSCSILAGHTARVALAAMVIAAAGATTPSAWLQPAPADGPLTQQQIEDGLKVLTPRRIATLMRERGTTFIFDPEGERRFRAGYAGKLESGPLDEIVRIVAPPRNPPPGTEWVAPTDRRKLVWVPNGVFQMGSPASERARDADETPHAVTVASGFWMDATEVTNRSFQRFVLANPEWQKHRIDRSLHDGNYLSDWKGNEFPQGKAEAPVVYVSWYASRAYAAWAGKRLPSEAEWEYACRAGSRTTYWWGEAFDASSAHGDAAAVNPWGLIAMTAGVWEWTSSLYRNYPFADDGRNDPLARGARVSRGGSGSSGAAMRRSANRNGVEPVTCNDTLGLRCAL